MQIPGLLIGTLSGSEMLIVLGVAVLLFGGKKLADVGKGLGEGIKNFKSAMKEPHEDPPQAEPKKPV